MKAKWFIALGCVGFCAVSGYVTLSLYSLSRFLGAPQAKSAKDFDLVRELKKSDHDPKSISSGLAQVFSNANRVVASQPVVPEKDIRPESSYENENDWQRSQRELRDIQQKLRDLGSNGAYQSRGNIVDSLIAERLTDPESIEIVRGIIEDEIHRSRNVGGGAEGAAYLVRIHRAYLVTGPNVDQALPIAEQAILNTESLNASSDIYEQFSVNYPESSRTLLDNLEQKGVSLRTF